ncbi:MAG: hypothetical protein R8M45_04365 [Ghiorsea sp.]
MSNFTKYLFEHFTVGEKVEFETSSIGGKTVKKQGTVIRVLANGDVNISTNSPYKKTKSYPFTVKHDKVTAVK